MVTVEEIASLLESDAIFVILVIGGTAIGVKVADLILKKLLTFSKRTKSDLDELIIKSIRVPILLGLTILGIRIGLTRIAFLEPHSELLNQIFAVAWLALVGLMALRAIDVASRVSAIVWFKQSHANVHSFVAPLSKLGKTLLVFFIGLAAIAIFGIDVSEFIFGWGLFGFAIALALQPVLSDVFSGLSIVSQGSYRVGDKLILSSGEVAKITEIRLQNTILQDLKTGNYYSVSNTDLIKQKITILPNGVLPISIPFEVDYNDMQHASDIAMKVGKEVDLLTTAPAVNVLELNSKAKLELLLSISDASKSSEVTNQTSSKLVNELKKEGIQLGQE